MGGDAGDGTSGTGTSDEAYSLLDRFDEADIRRHLVTILGIALIVAFALVLYVAVSPAADDDSFTEFYLTGHAGNASEYPTSLTVGDTGNVTVGLTNQEGADTTYVIRSHWGDTAVGEWSVTVEDGETWERSVEFRPETAGERPLQFDLYKHSDPAPTAEPDLRTSITVNVTDSS